MTCKEEDGSDKPLPELDAHELDELWIKDMEKRLEAGKVKGVWNKGKPCVCEMVDLLKHGCVCGGD